MYAATICGGGEVHSALTCAGGWVRGVEGTPTVHLRHLAAGAQAWQRWHSIVQNILSWERAAVAAACVVRTSLLRSLRAVIAGETKKKNHPNSGYTGDRRSALIPGTASGKRRDLCAVKSRSCAVQQCAESSHTLSRRTERATGL
ncbi:hypothetical protein ABVT39_009257 [Epinephelus coioides]